MAILSGIALIGMLAASFYLAHQACVHTVRNARKRREARMQELYGGGKRHG